MKDKKSVSVKEIGRIREIKKSIVKIAGLSNCMLGQLVSFSDDTKGLVMGFNERYVLALILNELSSIKAGTNVYAEFEPFRVPVGNGFLSRVVNSLCEPLDGKKPIDADDFYDIFQDAPALLDRIPITEMLLTGIRAIDSSIPVGKGQRELIIGDRMTGKTSIAIDAILSQKGRNVVCIYCCIGRDYASFEKAVGIFKRNNALDYTIMVSALGMSSIGEQYLAPYTAATIGSYFMYSGRDVLVVFDDLTKHAWAYRELSLLLERPPGREAYPGDIFYLHAQLMERAGRLSPEKGGGSMSFLPIADTLEGDIAGFIPTNLISMTDGQIVLSSTLFGEGIKPAIDLGLSVSRIGSKVQSELMRELTRDIGLNYIQYREMLKATRLRAGVSDELAKRLKHGEKIESILLQGNYRPSSLAEQIILFYALKEGILDVLPDETCNYFKENIYIYANKNFPDLVKRLDDQEKVTAEDREGIRVCVLNFFKESHVDRGEG